MIGTFAGGACTDEAVLKLDRIFNRPEFMLGCVVLEGNLVEINNADVLNRTEELFHA